MSKAQKDSYSNFIRAAKFALPVLAIFMFASVFVFTKSNALRDGLIIPDKKLAQLAVGQKITNPHYSGVTRSGDAFSISAEAALPNAPKPDQIDLIAPSATLNFANGFEVRAHSETGRLQLDTQEATLSGTVALTTSDNYSAKAEKFIMDFYTGNASSPNSVQVTGPMGHISAGNMELTQNLHEEGFSGKAILRFGNGVKLVYYPNKKDE